jgi:transcriptional regulator GlxA family with amidase domain
MAEIARLSRTNLLINFRQATGRSPVEFLIGLRIEAAKRLLRQGDLGMTEIALETGFGDSNYFARKFRESTGRTPTEYRQRQRT